jgi:hypothetical protein
VYVDGIHEFGSIKHRGEMNYPVTPGQKLAEILRLDEVGPPPFDVPLVAWQRATKRANFMPGGDERGNNETASSPSCASDKNLGQFILLSLPNDA